jgi:Ase1/PRC1/MAP65 family protein
LDCLDEYTCTRQQKEEEKRRSRVGFLFCIISSVPQSPGYVKHAMFL